MQYNRKYNSSYHTSLFSKFLQFSFYRCHKSNDLYKIFFFEPLHPPRVGGQKCEGFYLARLRDTALQTKSIFPGRTEQTFPFVGRKVIVQHNRVLRTPQKASDGCGLLHKFSKNDVNILIRTFTESRLLGRLALSDCQLLNSVSPFLGGIIEQRCREPEIASNTRMFTREWDILHHKFQRLFLNIGFLKISKSFHLVYLHLRNWLALIFKIQQPCRVCTTK